MIKRYFPSLQLHSFLASGSLLFCLTSIASDAASATETADMIALSGKVFVADSESSLVEAFAVTNGKFSAIGSNEEITKLRGDQTQVIDLQGKMVLPGLIDSHVHAAAASMVEFGNTIPDMETIGGVLQYVRDRATAVEEGEWIVLRQIFITRLKEQRFPTKLELDEAAPNHPVAFLTGPDGCLNTLGLEKVGISGDFKNSRELIVERNATTGEPNGIVRGATDHLKLDEQKPKASFEERDKRLIGLFKDYNSVGITAAIDKAVSREDIEQYRRLSDGRQLTVRFGLSYRIDPTSSHDLILDEIHDLTVDPLFSGDEFLRIIGVKTFLDGGMLTGSAYMREPWGISNIYGISDPAYRGLRYIDAATLTPLVELAVENDLQFTAHCVGDGAVHALLDAYELVSKGTPKVAGTHCCVTHSNFMSQDAIEKAAELGVCLDIQPAWLYLDTRTLVSQFGYDRLRYFQPLKSLFAAGVIAGGGSDHMQKIGSLRSINPYNPFLGMWTSIARNARWYEGRLHPEEALSREQAIRLYTWNSAYVLRRENDLGSIEPGKLADFIIIDQDLMSCPLDAIKETKVLATYLGGVKVYEAPIH